MSQCLLRNYGNPDFCKPLNPIYIGLHGADGKGGRVANSNTPQEYNGLLLDDSPVYDDQLEIYEKLTAYIRSFDKQFEDVQKQLTSEGKSINSIRIKSLYLWSESPGTGKTTTAVALLNEYLVKNYIGSLKRKQSPNQRPVYFLDANQLQTEYNTFNRPKVPEDIANPSARRYYNAIEKAKRTDFVVCDDIGVRESTEGFRGDLHSIINFRVVNHLPTIFTSNVPISELSTMYGEGRLADRISDMTMELHFDGNSKRGMRR